MLRDSKGTLDFWSEWIAFEQDYVEERLATDGSANPNYFPQFLYDTSKGYLRLILRGYSRGDRVDELSTHFEGLLDLWERSERLGREVWSDQEWYRRHSWSINLDHYMHCFWVVGLAILLEVRQDQWQRLLSLVGNEGEDELLDRVIATRQPDRKVSSKLCFPKVYELLLAAVNAPVEQQSELLRQFLDRWYPNLKRAGSPKLPSSRDPYWYDYGDQNFEGGAYFGRWCIEAAVAAKLFGIDDALCLSHPYYPGDLVRDGRSPRRG